jgi:hypothetical protein
MGVISITLPIKATGNFRIRDKKAAKKLVEELEQIGERIVPVDELTGVWKDDLERIEEVETARLQEQKRAFDEAFGMWADRDPKELDELMRSIRRRNNGRD